MMSVFLPERDESYDLLEMIEHPSYLTFHQRTLHLYCSLVAQGNQKVAHTLCKHVDEQQLTYVLQSSSETFMILHNITCM